jgi:transposase InsO family protein
MVLVLRFVAALLAWLRRSQLQRDAEILYLRQQLIVLKRSAPAGRRLKATDRLIFVCLYHLFPSLLQSSIIFRPETLLRWHRRGFRLFWRWKSRRPAGRPPLSTDVRILVRRISRENPLWGAPRIHGELLKLGIEISQSTVAKYMVRRRGPPSQGWKTFLHNHTPHIAAIDMFVVPTIGFRLLYGLAIIHLQRRRLIWTDVTANPTAEWIARQITEAFPWNEAPGYLIRDRDASYGHAFTKRLAAMGIRDHPTAPRSPWQNLHIERLIGSIRRECLDHVLVLDEAHLRRILRAYADYYNRARTHLALEKDAPVGRPVQAIGSIVALPLLGGLHHQYARMA